MARGDYKLTEYLGGYSSFEPTYGSNFTGYNIPVGDIGLSGDSRTANVLKDISDNLNVGTKAMELPVLQPEILQSIPKGHLKEVNRLAKLTGTSTTLHGVIVEPSGLTERGFDEAMRQVAERQMQLSIDKANELNPDKSSPVTFHTSVQIPGTQWKPTADGGKTEEKIIAIDQRTGEISQAKEEIKYYPERMLKPEIEEKIKSLPPEQRRIEIDKLEKSSKQIYIPLKDGKIYNPRKQLEIINSSEWDNSLNQIFFNKERVDEILKNSAYNIQHILDILQRRKENQTINEMKLTQEEQKSWNTFVSAENYLQDLHAQINNKFSNAYEFGNEEQRKKLEEYSKKFQEQIEKAPAYDILTQTNAMTELTNNLKGIVPEIHVPVEKFAMKKTAETFANIAKYSYDKYQDKAPIISIENAPYGTVLTSGEEIKELIDKTREEFVKKLSSEGISKSEAEKQAKKLIGVTWDVGHINMMRKQGFDKKEVIKQSEAVAPFVKHVHLSDNFGLEHTELPMGMGNVPIKEIMERLGEEGFEGKKIIEAGNWWQHFSPGQGKENSPFQYSLEAFGSPIYADSTGPLWNQAIGFQQPYNQGLAGPWLPSYNFEQFGTNFSQLPSELGGQRPGAQGSRMSGRPME